MAGNLCCSTHTYVPRVHSLGPLLLLIQKRERFTEREASQVTREVANALAFLHEQGIICHTYSVASI